MAGLRSHKFQLPAFRTVKRLLNAKAKTDDQGTATFDSLKFSRAGDSGKYSIQFSSQVSLSPNGLTVPAHHGRMSPQGRIRRGCAGRAVGGDGADHRQRAADDGAVQTFGWQHDDRRVAAVGRSADGDCAVCGWQRHHWQRPRRKYTCLQLVYTRMQALQAGAMCVCMPMTMDFHTYVHTCVHAHAFTHVHTHVYTYVYTHVYTHMPVRTSMHMSIRTFIHLFMRRSSCSMPSSTQSTHPWRWSFSRTERLYRTASPP